MNKETIDKSKKQKKVAKKDCKSHNIKDAFATCMAKMRRIAQLSAALQASEQDASHGQAASA